MNTGTFFWAALSLLWAGAMMIGGAHAEAAKPGGMVINEDNSHFFGTRTADDMTLEGLHAFVDQYAGTGVSHLFLCPNAMRASFASETRDAIWDLGKQQAPEARWSAWQTNARLLHERNLDPYAIWIARCREKGISPWLSMRMNDVHAVDDPTNFMHSTFWLEHPDYWRVPGGSGWVDRAFDYAIPEVREHAMSFIRELLERYDPDGLELDWMRFGYHFKPGAEEQGATILTEFMREARELANEWSEKRGHPILLGARVPAHPDAAKGLGMDGVAWCQQGLVDMLVPCPFWTTSDFDIPVELWRERIGAAAGSVILAPGLEFNVRAHPGAEAVPNTLESVRGFAAASWFRGADQIYLFNFMDSETIPVSKSDYRTLLEQGLAPDTVTRLPRRHIQSFRDTVPPGFPNGAALPAEALESAAFHINTGRAPQNGEVFFVAGLAERESVQDAVFEMCLNGQPCDDATDQGIAANMPGAARRLCFRCPLDAIRDGYNEATVTQIPGSPAQQIVWAEIQAVPGE